MPVAWGALVFPSQSGSLVNPSNARGELASLALVAGIEYAVIPHTLRHTCASHLVHAGVPLRCRSGRSRVSAGWTARSRGEGVPMMLRGDSDRRMRESGRAILMKIPAS